MNSQTVILFIALPLILFTMGYFAGKKDGEFLERNRKTSRND